MGKARRVKRKYILLGLTTVIILSSFLIFTTPVYAQMEAAAGAVVGATGSDVGEAIAEAIVWVLSHLVNFLLQTIAFLTAIIIGIAGYNNFVNETAIVDAWVIVRDIANMFFVVVFLVIAIGTILGAEQYHWKKALPRLILMAVLINFSRTICGVLIDFAQVIMLTFVNAFKETAAGNFIYGLGLNDVWSPNMGTVEKGGLEFYQLVFSYFLAAIVTIVAFVVIVVLTVVLLFRVVMLWLLVVISPLAFFASAVPSKTLGGGGYFGEWWKQFINNVISGPILAFFLWLALTVMATSDTELHRVAAGGATEGIAGLADIHIGASKAGAIDVFLKYLISLGMLIGGLWMTSQLRVIGSGLAAKAPLWLQKQATSLAKKGAMAPLRALDDRYRIREGAWSAASKIPLMGRFALEQKGKVMGQRAALISEKEKGVAALGWEDKLKIAKGRALTADDRARKIAAMKDFLHNKADQFKMRDDLIKGGLSKDQAAKRVQTEMQTALEQYNKLGEDRKDKSITGDAYKLKLERPNLIKNDADREKFVKGMMLSDVLNISPLAAGDEVVRRAIASRVGEMSDLQIARLPKEFFGEEITAEDGTKQWQARAEIPQAIMEQKTGGELDRLFTRLPDVMKESLQQIQIPLPKFEEMIKKDELSVGNLRMDQLQSADMSRIIAQHGSARLKADIQKDVKKAGAYRDSLLSFKKANLDVAAGKGLDPSGRIYSPESLAVASEILQSGAGVTKSFNVDVNGNFAVTPNGEKPDEISFVETIRENPTLILSIKPEELKGELAINVRDVAENSAVLRSLYSQAQTADQREIADAILREVYKHISEISEKDPKAQDLKNYLEKGTFAKKIAEIKKRV